MMTNDDTTDSILCIYCKKRRPRPSRGEHVMLEALGGTQKILDVCGGRDGCNQKFGDTIDRELLRNSPVTLHRLVISKGQTHEQQMFYFRTDHGVWLDTLVRVGSKEMILPPQLYLHNGKPLIIASPEFEKWRLDLASKTVDELARAAPLFYDWDQSAPARIVFQPSRGRYAARARSPEHFAEFLDVLRETLPAFAARVAAGTVERVTLSADAKIVLPLGTAVNDSPRCAAKMAFNFLSLYLGPEVALRTEFDSVRQYITGERVEPIVDTLTENGEYEVSVDTRHVANWFTTDLTANHWKLLREAHYITLLAKNRELGAEVGLFGGRSRFLIRFGKVGPDLVVERPLPAVLVTPIGGGGDRILAGADLVEELQQTGRI